VCNKINHDDVATLAELTSDHEEADTKLVAFVHASQLPLTSTEMVQSLSGDIDMITLFIGHNFSDTQILIDNGSRKNRKIIDVTSTGLSLGHRRALLGMHAFSPETTLADSTVQLSHMISPYSIIGHIKLLYKQARVDLLILNLKGCFPLRPYCTETYCEHAQIENILIIPYFLYQNNKFVASQLFGILQTRTDILTNQHSSIFYKIHKAMRGNI
jgi:hypothetical protein